MNSLVYILCACMCLKRENKCFMISWREPHLSLRQILSIRLVAQATEPSALFFFELGFYPSPTPKTELLLCLTENKLFSYTNTDVFGRCHGSASYPQVLTLN